MAYLRLSISSIALFCMLLLASAARAQEPAAESAITRQAILDFSPKANPRIVATLSDNMQRITKSGMNTELRLLHFFSQMATETGGFRRLDENLNYSAERLRLVFGGRVSAEKAISLASQPVQIANYVYANRLGNGGPETNDGWNFRGSGFLQLTGRANFRQRGLDISMPLEKEPDLVRQAKTGLDAAIAYWLARGINHAADKDDLVLVRKLVNGGTNGLAAARLWYLQARKRLIKQTGAPADLTAILEEEKSALAEALSELGYGQPKGVPGYSDGPESALKAFQKDHGLTETGFLDSDTLYAITDPDGRFAE
jgi:putative chitinase